MFMLAAAANASTLVGIGDQGAATFRDPLFAPLAVGISRVVVPWNAVRTEPARPAEWADAAREAGVDPIVAFGHAAGDACPASPCALPALAEYREAFLELRARYPWIHTFTPWNEPN